MILVFDSMMANCYKNINLLHPWANYSLFILCKIAKTKANFKN